MSKKKMLTEGTVRSFMKLAKLDNLSSDFLQENYADSVEEAKVEESEELEEEDTLEEGESAGSNVDSNRKGTKQNNHSGESGIASNQGKEPKSTPDGTVDHSHPDHKLKNTAASKKSIDSGTSLAEGLYEMEDELGGEEEMGVGGPPPMGEPDGDEMPPAPGGGGEDLEGLVRAIADAISQHTGVDVSVAGGDPMGAPDGEEGMPPVGDEPEMGGALPAEMGAGPDAEGEEMMGDEEEEDDFSQMQESDRDAMVESIAKRVAKRLAEGSRKVPAKKAAQRKPAARTKRRAR
jgi:hypothetical protein